MKAPIVEGRIKREKEVPENGPDQDKNWHGLISNPPKPRDEQIDNTRLGTDRRNAEGLGTTK